MNTIEKIKQDGIKISDVYFRRDLNGNVILWYAEAKPGKTSKFSIIHRWVGAIEGACVKHHTAIIKGAGLNKFNERYISQAAITRLNKYIKDKVNAGYRKVSDFDTEFDYDNPNTSIQSIIMRLSDKVPHNRLDANNYIKPMYAKKYKPTMKIEFPLLAQPKINGVRCMVSYVPPKQNGLFNTEPAVRITSREGIIYKLPELEKQMLAIYEHMADKTLVFDGEYYIDKLAAPAIAGFAKTGEYTADDWRYVIYDLALFDVEQRERSNKLEGLFYGFEHLFDDNGNLTKLSKKAWSEVKNVLALHTTAVLDKEHIVALRDKFIAMGYEGVILRKPDGEYQFGKRNMTMLKYKKVTDAEFLIVDIIPAGDSKTKDGRDVALFVCMNDKTSETFKVTPKGYTMEQRADILENKEQYIGELLTVEFYERTANQLPFHANGFIRTLK